VRQGKRNCNICGIRLDWSSEVLALRKKGEKQAYDQRIQGQGDFVEKIKTNPDNLVLKNLQFSGKRIDIAEAADERPLFLTYLFLSTY
jgi:hypothetical protein